MEKSVMERAELQDDGAVARPCVLHIPHASRTIPPALRDQFLLDDETLTRELDRMTDSFTDLLFPDSPRIAKRIIAGVSRLVCDVERFPDDADEPMALRGMGALYERCSDGARLRTLTAGQRLDLLEAYYHPHHAALTAAVDEVLTRSGEVVLIDCHSFSSAPLPYEPDQAPDRPDICIGTDPVHTPQALRDRLVILARSDGFSVDVDTPYAGALVPLKYYRTETRVHAVMIEVNRRLYMDEASVSLHAGFERTRRLVGKLIEAAGSADDQPPPPPATDER
jgi:N-formylglutamate deformylase